MVEGFKGMDVAAWLRGLGLERYEPAFREQAVDARVLPSLTAEDLKAWVTTSARSYAASGIKAGERVITTYNAGPFVAGA